MIFLLKIEKTFLRVIKNTPSALVFVQTNNEKLSKVVGRLSVSALRGKRETN